MDGWVVVRAEVEVAVGVGWFSVHLVRRESRGRLGDENV